LVKDKNLKYRSLYARRVSGIWKHGWDQQVTAPDAGSGVSWSKKEKLLVQCIARDQEHRYTWFGFSVFLSPGSPGSTSYVTDATGEVYQHLEYFAFGETFVGSISIRGTDYSIIRYD